MRTLCLNVESSSVALACGSPGHVISGVLKTDPIGNVFDRLAELFATYKPEKVFLDGDRNASMDAVEYWLSERGIAFLRTPESALVQMTNALTMGAADLDIVDGPALFENCRPGEGRALAALELNHRLTNWATDQLQRSGGYA